MKDLKLTKTQLDVYNKMLADLERDRQYKTVEEYYRAFNPEWAKWEDEDEFRKNRYIKRFEEMKENIVYVWASSSTLKVLERKGLIKIIVDGKLNTDKVKIL